jgi:hypothetical protein
MIFNDIFWRFGFSIVGTTAILRLVKGGFPKVNLLIMIY